MSSDADPAEIAGLRARLARQPDDRAVRLQLAHALIKAGENPAARSILAPLVPGDDARPDPAAVAALTTLAHLDENEGDREAAIARWEVLLADDIDHAEARARVAHLRGAERHPLPPSGLATATIVAPLNVTTARYTIVRELGRGAFATVYLARDTQLEIPIALKVMHPSVGAASRASAHQRFLFEARAAARLRHPGIIAIYDVDVQAHSLAMEYLPAGTLRARLDQQARDPATPLDAHEILATLTQLLDALAEVHAAGLVHADIKPRNILLRGPGRPVLADFGVARLAALPAGETQASGPAGTPFYLAPEQFAGAAPSIATDLFAVGAIGWEMASGEPLRSRQELTHGAFGARALPATAAERLRAASAATARVVTLLDRLLSSAPEERPADARAALALLG